MSTISIIIISIMVVTVLISFSVLYLVYKEEKNVNIVDVPSYDDSIEEILNNRNKDSDGVRLTQKELLEKTDYVLSTFD